MTRKRLILLIAPMALAAGACFATSNLALAYPAPTCAIHETSGSPTSIVGTGSAFTFQVVDSKGNPDVGQAVGFSASGAAGTVSPTSQTSGASGDVSTSFTGSATGTALITATATTAAGGSCSGTAATNVDPGAVLGTSTTTGSGSGTPLPNTGTLPPGPSPLIVFGLGLAMMILIGGGVTLRRSRDSAN